jgi:hypothetical protein
MESEQNYAENNAELEYLEWLADEKAQQEYL